MPELAPESTPPSAAPLPPEPDDEATGPPVIDPARFEDFPVFRETFLSFVAGAHANATLRRFGNLLYNLTLEYWQFWPDQPEGQLRASLRAAVADMRHVQGFLVQWASPETDYKTPHQERLAKFGGVVARDLGALADCLEEGVGGMSKRKDAALTLHPRPKQLERWQAVAKHLHRDLPDYVAFAADWTYRYLREQIRMRKRSDPVAFRMEEKRRMDAVLKEAREVKKFLPLPFETRHGIPVNPAEDLDRAITNLEAFWAEYQTELQGV